MTSCKHCGARTAVTQPGPTMTADRLRLWLAAHPAAIEEKQKQRANQIADAAAALVYQAMRNRGLTLNAAGDDLLLRFPYGLGGRAQWTPAELKSALVTLGWEPKGCRQPGGVS